MADAVLVFLDTNVYLHYQMFDQVNWLDTLKVQAARIVVPPTTIRELNRVKDTSPQPQVRKRSGKVLKRFSELFPELPEGATSLRKGVDILFHPDEPLIDFTAHHLSREVQDDHLMASIIAYREQHVGSEVLLVTADAGVLMIGKARRHGIQTIACPENLKLAEQPDPDQVQIRELQAELTKLKNRLPKLNLEFEDGSKQVEFTLVPVAEIAAGEIETALEEIKRKHPKKAISGAPQRSEKGRGVSVSDIIAASQLPFDTLSQEDIVQYNAQLDTYFEEYEKYLRNLRTHEMAQARLARLEIFIANTGTAPAKNIDIFMHFPDGFELLRKAKVPKPPRVPVPPSPPKSTMQIMMEGIRTPMMDYSSYLSLRPEMPSDDPPPNVTFTSIRHTNSYDVRLNVRKMKHKMFEGLIPLYILFDSVENAASFTITYTLLTDDLPDEVSGELHVVVKKSSTSDTEH